MRAIRVFVVDKFEPTLLGIKMLLERDEEIQVIGTHLYPSTGTICYTVRPDVIIWACEEGRDEIRKSISLPTVDRFPPVILYVDHLPDNSLPQLKDGVSGFVVKKDMQELLLAIRVVSKGAYYISREFIEVLNPVMAEKVKAWAEVKPASPSDLTEMEAKVVQELIKDKTNQEIAAALHISRRTVEHHIASAIDKLGANSRVGLAVKTLLNDCQYFSSSGCCRSKVKPVIQMKDYS